MPIYPYACTACGHRFDKIQKFSDDALVTCPECGQDTLKKELAAPAFQLKGTGWYVTDFRDKKKPESKKPEDKSGASTSDSASTSEKSAGATASDSTTKPTKPDAA